MSPETPRHPMTTRRLVYCAPGADAVAVQRDLAFAGSDGDPLAMDVYLPAGAARDARVPAVIMVHGYTDPGFQRLLGCRFKDMAVTVDWARSMAASGLAAITYTNRNPVGDVESLLRHVGSHLAPLGIDADRLGLFACSGHGPLALSVLMSGLWVKVKCAALMYPCTLDLGGAGDMADAAARFRFAYPCTGKSLDDLPTHVPLFIARAGRDDTPGLNVALDRFVSAALARNLPIELINHASAPHAFDLLATGEPSKEIVRLALAFLRVHLV